MKTKEEILEHLKNVGYLECEIPKIMGFLVGIGVKAQYEDVQVLKGTHTFDYFYNWVEIKKSIIISVNPARTHWLKAYIDELKNKTSVPEPKHKVGDWVRVTDTLQTYITYDKAFKAMNFKDLDKNPSVKYDSVGKIFGVYYCNANNCYIYGIQFGDKQCAMNDKGIIAYYPKEGEFFCVKTDTIRIIGCRDCMAGNHDGSVLHSSYLINKDSAELFKNMYSCQSNVIKTLRPATEEEIELLQKVVKRDENKEWKDGKWVGYEQDKIEKAKKEFEEWKSNYAHISILDWSSLSNPNKDKRRIVGKLSTYTELYLFAQWQNSLNKGEEEIYYLAFDIEIIPYDANIDCLKDGSIFFNTAESAQLAIDVLGKELIKTALQ